MRIVYLLPVFRHGEPSLSLAYWKAGVASLAHLPPAHSVPGQVRKREQGSLVEEWGTAEKGSRKLPDTLGRL